MTPRTAVLALVVVGCCAQVLAHPHDGDVYIQTLRGRVTAVDLNKRTLALDAVDWRTKQMRNVLVFLDPKVKVTRAKKKMALADLVTGEPIICVVEVEMTPDGQAGKMIAFDIQVDLKASRGTE